MKKLLTPILLAVLIALLTAGGLAGCIGYNITGSGNLTTETFDLSGFTVVAAHSGFQVEVTQSTSFSIEITADDNIHQFIEVEMSGGTLDIRLRGNRFYHSVTIRAVITMPDLDGIELSGGSQASITGFSSGHDFWVEMSGGSQLNGNITTGDIDFELSGGSQVNLEGAADDLTIDASGGSQLDLEDFPVGDANIDMSGGGRATVNVSGTLSVDLSGGSQVFYVGQPAMGDIQLSGGSTVSRK